MRHKKRPVDAAKPPGDAGPRPKGEATKHCCIRGMGQEWDGIPEVRDRVRGGGPVLDPRSKPKTVDISHCAMNHQLLAPLASRICLAERKVPNVDDLRDEVAALLTMNKRQGEDLIVLVEDTAKHLKTLCCFLKTKVRRKEVSVATRTRKILGMYRFSN